MTANAVIAVVILAACLFLLVFGERVSDWLDRRATQPAPEQGDAEIQRRIDERIAAERDPGRRAAWRMLRDRDHTPED